MLNSLLNIEKVMIQFFFEYIDFCDIYFTSVPSIFHFMQLHFGKKGRIGIIKNLRFFKNVMKNIERNNVT